MGIAVAAGETAGKERSVSPDQVEIRECDDLDEMRACVGLQKEVWNFSDIELVPLRLFVVAGKVGGQVVGAFDRGELVSFALAVPGVRGGRPYLHSHMLAVRAEYRNGGLGRRMKLFQREHALARGFELMEWTFDPLEIKNSYLNIRKLGAISRRYSVNQYGITTSPLQGGLPTDRLVAEWWLNSKRVTALLEHGSFPACHSVASIAVPAQIYEWKASQEHRARAQEVQERNKSEFQTAFGRGLAVLGYERDAQGNGEFLLGNWDENWSYDQLR
jgi:predicted GNAT superfamily acetyltransferase